MKNLSQENSFDRKRRMVREYFKDQLRRNQISHTRIQWDKLDSHDFVNWPENLAFKSPMKYNKAELTILLSQLENIRFSEKYIRENRDVGDYVSHKD